MRRYGLWVLLFEALLAGPGRDIGAAEASERTDVKFTVSPIGWVRQEEGRTRIVLEKKYQPGLLGLEGFSHVYVFWWFDRNDTAVKRQVLQVHPRGNPRNPLTGVFATRSPVRPNLIALTLCKIVSVKDNVVELDSIDAMPNTPVLDLKPYTGRDMAGEFRVPDWARAK